MPLQRQPRRFIETYFPIRELGIEGPREIQRHMSGHPSILHQWWARRPMVTCRAVILGCLLLDPLDDLAPEIYRKTINDHINDEFLQEFFPSLQNSKSASNQQEEEGKDTVNRCNTKKVDDDRSKISRFIDIFCRHSNSLNSKLINIAKVLIKSCFPEFTPSLIDIFAGSGTIPLEGVRMGLNSFGSDLNPVAHLIELTTADFPFRFHVKPPAHQNDELEDPVSEEEEKNKTDRSPPNRIDGFINALPQRKYTSILASEVYYWGKIVLKRTWKRMREFYPCSDRIPLVYLWSRYIRCKNPICKAKIPVLKQKWIAKRGRYNYAVDLNIEEENRKINFEIVSPEPDETWPNEGTKKGSYARCPICGDLTYLTNISLAESGIRWQDKNSEAEEEEKEIAEDFVLAVVEQSLSEMGEIEDKKSEIDQKTKISDRAKSYRLPSEEDLAAYKRAVASLEILLRENPEDFPDEELPKNRQDFGITKYGVLKWSDMFNARQNLVHISFLQEIRNLEREIRSRASNYIITENNPTNIQDTVETSTISGDTPSKFTKAVQTYLAFALDKVIDHNSRCSFWVVGRQATGHTFARLSLQPIWDYSEVNPFNPKTGSFLTALYWICKTIDALSDLKSNPANISINDAKALPHADGVFDLVVTDPPYYDTVAYGDLSDFFYVFLKRTLGGTFEEIFRTAGSLTPKKDEIIVVKGTGGDRKKAKKSSDDESTGSDHTTRSVVKKDSRFFEAKMTEALKEAKRVLKEDGCLALMYTHKKTSAWEAIINAILSSGYTITASWPVATESTARMPAQKASALSTTMIIVCRPRNKFEKDIIGEWGPLTLEIEEKVKERMDFLQSEDICGIDAVQAAFGPAMEIFSRYSRIEKLDGSTVSIREAIETIRSIINRISLNGIFPFDDERTPQSFSDDDLASFNDGGHDNPLEGKRIDPITTFYVIWRWNHPQTSEMTFDEANKIARAVGIEINLLIRPRSPVQRAKKDTGKISLSIPGRGSEEPDYLMRETDTTSFKDSLIVDIHRACQMWNKNKMDDLARFGRESGFVEGNAHKRVVQALISILPKTDPERQMLEGVLSFMSRGDVREVAPWRAVHQTASKHST